MGRRAQGERIKNTALKIQKDFKKLGDMKKIVRCAPLQGMAGQRICAAGCCTNTM